MSVRCPCCGTELTISLAAVAGVAVKSEVKSDEPVFDKSDGVWWRLGVNSDGSKPCERAFQKDNLVGSDLSPKYAELYNWLVSAEKPFLSGFFYWKDDDLGYIGRVKCRDKFAKGGS